MTMTAVLSDCGTYRYRLTREWGDGGRVVWVMLNPSTADADRDDATIRKIVKFSKAWGYGSLEVVNLFALRATHPVDLAKHLDPVGPDNDLHITGAVLGADLIIAAWGASYPNRCSLRPHKVGKLLRERDVHVLGLTANGVPRHPLYMLDETLPVRWAS
jgi:hypothetical protein